MDILGIDITKITELATQVANAGALHDITRAGDELFQMVVAIAIVASRPPLV